MINCQQFREILDSYLADELLIETNHEILRHLENCRLCRDEIADRRMMLAQIRNAVKNNQSAQINIAFSLKLKKELRETMLSNSVWKNYKINIFETGLFKSSLVAAAILIGFLSAAFWVFRILPEENNLTYQASNLNSNFVVAESAGSLEIKSVRTRFFEAVRLAVGDHKNCALQYRLKEDPISLEEAAEKYGKFNKDLDKVVKTAVRKIQSGKSAGDKFNKLEFLEAHSCVFAGRRFAHVVLRKNNKTISLLITDADDSAIGDKSLTAENSTEDFSVADFQIGRRAVFVVSDLSRRENLEIAENLTSVVKLHIEKTEA